MGNKLLRNTNHKPLGVFSDGKIVYIFYHLGRDEGSFFRIESSLDGVNFSLFNPICEIVYVDDNRVDAREISNLTLTKAYRGYYLFYKRKLDKKAVITCAFSENLTRFKEVERISSIHETGYVVSDYQYHGKYVMYFGENSINLAFSYDFKKWKLEKNPVLAAKKDFFGISSLTASNAFLIDEGLLVFYFDQKKHMDKIYYFLHAALFDKNNPSSLLKLIDDPLWEPNSSWHEKKLEPVGVVILGGELISYWQDRGSVIALVHPFAIDHALEKESLPHLVLKKLKHNPIIKPIVDNFWESKATFNPAAFSDEDKVHIIYRAIGDHDISVLGYATSSDGIHIDSRYPEPIYKPTQPFEGVGTRAVSYPAYSPFASGGGGYGGVEDPRVTKIDKRIYMTYVAYDGMRPPRVALTSISEGDFHNQKWNWGEPVLISPPGVVNKNACILPEKIDGKYVIFHRIFPDILIDFVDDLNFDGTKFLKGDYKISPRINYWDSRKVGVGATPIKTDAGWLLVYQAVGDNDPGKYKIGAMILDKGDPTKVIYRSKKPIIEPDQEYENNGYKAGVAYPCGAVEKDGELIVYYGGADTVVCAAHENFDYFIKKLKEHKEEDIVRSFSVN